MREYRAEQIMKWCDIRDHWKLDRIGRKIVKEDWVRHRGKGVLTERRTSNVK